YETNLFPDREYTFKHALTHEVAYAGLLGERRRALHARIVGILEQEPAGGRPELIEQLAHHAVRGEMWDPAVRYLQQAAALAIGRSAHRAAATHLTQALAALAHLPDDRTRREQKIDIHLAMRTALQPLGDTVGILQSLQSAQALAVAIGDSQRLARVC